MWRKTTVWIFQATNHRHLTGKKLDMAKKGKPFERDWISTNSCTKQRHKDVMTNYAKVKIDKTQQNSKCRLCGDRDEWVNCLISEFCKILQKEYKTRHSRVEKVIHQELCN